MSAISGSARALARHPGRMLRAKAMNARTCISVIFFLLSSFIRLPPFGVSLFCAAKVRGGFRLPRFTFVMFAYVT